MRRRAWTAAWMTLAWLAPEGLARAADPADGCADAYELAQSERMAGRLLGARSEARLCAASCPRRLAADCAAWEAAIDLEIPSFLVEARGADGAPLAVEVQVDGATPTYAANGAIEAEPGLHRLSVRHLGTRVETGVTFVAGVRNQLVELTFTGDLRAGPTAAAALTAPLRNEHPSVSTWRWVLGGVGLGSTALGGAVSLSGEVLAAQLRDSCKPHCTQSEVNEVVQRWTAGGILMGAGGAMFLTALLWPSGMPTPGRGSTARVSVGPEWAELEVTF